MRKISNTNESKKAENWTSKKELMDICKCGKTTLEQIINDLNCPIDRAIQNHMKKGGYHNLETYYDDYLKKLNDFNTTQLGYYTKKYHSWYDDYENY